MSWRRFSFSILWVVFISGSRAFPAPEPSEDSLEALMPDDVVGYAKLRGLGPLLSSFLESDLRKELESMEIVKLGFSQEAWHKFQRELAAFREASGKDPLQVFKDLLGKEILIGGRIGFSGPEFIFLTRAASKKELADSLEALRQALEKRLGHPLQGVQSTYEDRGLETLDKVAFASLGEVLAVSTTENGLKKVIDLSTGKSTGSVKKSAVFHKAAERARGDSIVSIAFRPQFIPNFNIPDKLDNPLGSLLLGGWAGVLGASDLLTASLEVKEGSLNLEISSALSPRAQDESYSKKFQPFFPETMPDGVVARLKERGVLGIVQLHRHLAQWWENREALLVPRAAGDLIQFSQVMNIVFGRNFQDEVLQELGSTITIVARNQEYPGLDEKPKPTIPGVAAVFELKKTKEFGNNMVAAFYTLIGIINADRAQKKKEGAMAMIPRPEKAGDFDMHTVSLNLSEKGGKPGIAYNFTPSMAVVGSRVILSSSGELARILVEELSKDGGKTAAGAVSRGSDLLYIDGKAAHSILRENRDNLVADNMLKKGIKKEQAEKEFDAFLEILRRVRDLRVESARDREAVELEIKLTTVFEPEPVEKQGGDKRGKEAGKSAQKKAVRL